METNNKIKKIIILIVLFLSVIFLVLMALKNKNNLNNKEKVFTNKERLEVLEKLDVGVNKSTQNISSGNEIIKYLDSIPDARTSSGGTQMSKEEIENILNATN